MTASKPHLEETSSNLTRAEENFRTALLRARQTRDHVGDLESAAAQFCRAARREGLPPEQMLKNAKRVIDETIGGASVAVAEHAVLVCIQHYFRTD